MFSGFKLDITRRHIGLLLVIFGTVVLALSIRVKPQIQDRGLREIARNHPDSIQLTETTIIRWRFWLGLVFVAIGTALQW